MARIMLVDDEPHNLSAMGRVLRMQGDHEIERFEQPAAALERAREIPFDIVIADYRMPGMDGALFLQAFRQIQPHAYRIIVSGYADSELFRSAINQAQLHRFIEKPADNMVLLQAVEEGLAQSALQREVVQLREEMEQVRKLLDTRTALLKQVAEDSPGALPADWEEAPD
ncbi:MAG: response regulator [Gammaproteobacteria bacterium HGW-Gammaproteobacteria-1]|jgi:response regulator RpfG family c-di-GMP phosphodiesterase|nr:MAG: response regulator [Gammaproteobacteria bacterium HGW-Gammaproteobacteria-1]